jgi:molecular chaperone GrpE (heat shock protein)
MKRTMENENELRVTDRRRVYLDDQGTEQASSETEQPSLKPKYVEELEARTKAAEKQVQEVQSRFDQLRQQLQRETDETRQRLNRSADERAAGEKAKFIASLLPALDNLNRAIANADAPRESRWTEECWRNIVAVSELEIACCAQRV